MQVQTFKPAMLFLFSIILICGVVFLYNNLNSNENKLLVTEDKEIVKNKIKLGLIKVYATLPENTNDIYSGLDYNVQGEECHVYRDIFGRYYCRW